MTDVKLKVLFTGSWERMIDNLMDRMTNDYQMLRAPLSQLDFERALRQFRPDAIVVCLADEPREVVKVQEAVENGLKNAGLPLFAVGHDEDCQRMRQKVLVPNIETFARPLDTAGFLEALQDRGGQYQQAHLPTPVIKPSPEATTPLPAPMSQASYEAAFKELGLENDEEYYVEEITPERKAAEQKLVLHIERINLLKGRMSVLVVDDDVRMLNVIKLYLQDLYDVTVVPSGKLAVKFLAKKHADMVLLDYMMPELDGPAVLQLIREQSPCPNIPVLFLTGVSDKKKVLHGLEFRPNGYLLKPVTRMNLLERVTEILLGIE